MLVFNNTEKRKKFEFSFIIAPILSNSYMNGANPASLFRRRRGFGEFIGKKTAFWGAWHSFALIFEKTIYESSHTCR